jgi:hypothetical protein
MENIFGFELDYSFEELPNGLQKFDKPKENNCFKLKYLAKGPEFDLISTALEESTYINHITGKPFVRTSILYRQILKNIIISIDFPDNQELKSISINKTDLNTMNYTLVKMICKNWIKEVL